MKFTFDDSLPHQQRALESVAQIFSGQALGHGAFTVLAPSGAQQETLGEGIVDGMSGMAARSNRCTLGVSELLVNLNRVQAENALEQDQSLRSPDFTVEMETGTGKTYVYLRSALELNKLYGFTKFVVVVPSVAIREGVMKSVEMLRQHFLRLYDGVVFDAFAYDSSKMGRIRNFAVSDTVEIMVVTIGAINRDTNVFYKEQESLGYEKPVDIVRQTRPIVIVDEPQSVFGDSSARSRGKTQGKGQGRKAIERLEALATFRYSATPPRGDGSATIYRLDAIDAYEQGLVKQIEVASLNEVGAGLTGYIKVRGITATKRAVTASLELDHVDAKGKISRKATKVKQNDDLEELTGNPIYAGTQVLGISAVPGQEGVELTHHEGRLAEGDAIGESLPSDDEARLKIRKTIREHLNKELSFAREGLTIKVLSLFFIDAVNKYRVYEDGVPTAGVYQRIFEEEYRALIGTAKYEPLREAGISADPVSAHAGYFSIDPKGKAVDTQETNEQGRLAAQEAYALIMRDKERLTSRAEPLRFIFSHSALREGWDNPNVFQICALRTVGTVAKRRQILGRGLRLAVSEDGVRTTGNQINRLTVIADESYEAFADGLQKELSDDLGFTFGVVERGTFAHLLDATVDGETPQPFGPVASQLLWAQFVNHGYIAADGAVQDSLREDLRNDTLMLPPEVEHLRPQIEPLLRKIVRDRITKDVSLRYEVGRPDPARVESQEFRDLWDRISGQTVFRVDVDSEELIRECAEAVGEIRVAPRRVSWDTAGMRQTRGGVEADLLEQGTAEDVQLSAPLPDILTELQNRTGLTRRSLARILTKSGSLDQFPRNPVAYLVEVAERINSRKQAALTAGVVYEPVEGKGYSRQRLASEELVGYLRENIVMEEEGVSALPLVKSVWPHAVVDSQVEANFVRDLEAASEVKVYAKLPSWFVVPTPVGGYNPDWAVVVEKDGREHLYFVVETKGVDDIEELQPVQRRKVLAAKRHFEAVTTTWAGSTPAEYAVVSSLESLRGRW